VLQPIWTLTRRSGTEPEDKGNTLPLYAQRT